MTDLAAEIAGLPHERRVAAIAAREAADGARFETMLKGLYRAYYAAAPVQETVRALADAGPREPSPHFDEALLAGVRARQSALRRL